MPAVPAAAAVDVVDVADDAIVASDAVPIPLGKKKKLIIIIGAALAVLLAAGGGAAVFVLKERSAEATVAAQAGEDENSDDSDNSDDSAAKEEAVAKEEAAAKIVKADLKRVPTFVPLDPFTVNLADREAERFAQVGITLEVTDAKAGELLKAYMPVIRNNILLTLGSKTAGQLMERDGKLRLAAEIRREALRPLGYEIALPPPAAPGAAAKRLLVAAGDDESVPILAVHFSNFIIQ